MSTPDVRPVGDWPDAIGKTAARALHEAGVDSLANLKVRLFLAASAENTLQRDTAVLPGRDDPHQGI